MSTIARRVGGLVLLSLLALVSPVSAQNRVPASRPLEALVKASLMSLNDANLTGDYRVCHAVFDQPAHLDAEGKLVLRGFFATEPTRVSFEIDFIPNDGEWKLIRINVKVAPSADGPPVPEPAPEPAARPPARGKKT